ncbi:TetR/AcrR family transcriptional regulator [Nocardia neocaledoniensis]|uniref:TetR/AcrR family transcriptional regulator n=1 Tax=Nocardia neocaledoniensis TaxID=236511 RepID=UPI002458004C|nr:TetR/AcrR family transcriptional regulator [Nocardia neocaledoniensis]
MARPKEFDEDRAIDAAMRAFWSAGYEATSTQDLCAATGLGRSSIYNTFTSKHDLFERALRRYMTTKNASIFEILDGDAPARERLGAVLRQVADAPDEDPTGCLVVNSTIELAPRDPAVRATLLTDQERRLDALTATVREGQRAGDITTERSARDLAQFLTATIGGMRVAARGGADRATLEAIADTAMRCL